jgi:hypothetical protein
MHPFRELRRRRPRAWLLAIGAPLRRGRRGRAALPERSARELAALVAFALAAGAALEFFLDPRPGKRRRHIVRDRTTAAFRRRARKVERQAHYEVGKIVRVTRAITHHEHAPPELDDISLVRKIESELFRDRTIPRAAATALEQAPSEADAEPLTGRQRRVCLGERPQARVAVEPSLAPQQSPALDPNQTANVILHPLFLLFRDFGNAKPARGSGCLHPGLNPARSARPHFRVPSRSGVRPAGDSAGHGSGGRRVHMTIAASAAACSGPRSFHNAPTAPVPAAPAARQSYETPGCSSSRSDKRTSLNSGPKQQCPRVPRTRRPLRPGFHTLASASPPSEGRAAETVQSKRVRVAGVEAESVAVPDLLGVGARGCARVRLARCRGPSRGV